MIAPPALPRFAAAVPAASLLWMIACSTGDPSATAAQDCWGHGVEGGDCAQRVGHDAANLGVAPPQDDPVLAAGDCGDPVDCDAAAEVVEVEPITAGHDVEMPTPNIVTPPPRGDDDDATAEPATESPTPPPPPVTATSWPGTCAAYDVRRVTRRGQPFTDGELGCVRDVALNHEPLEIDDFTAIQEATIGLVNTRDASWQQAVERSLSYSELRNSPNLNFAGITPAYNQGRYSTVISRANCVWSNLDKGYAISAADRTFVAEFACRSGVQLHMQGQISPDHERWCRIWVDRLEHEGKDATEARGLLDQVE